MAQDPIAKYPSHVVGMALSRIIDVALDSANYYCANFFSDFFDIWKILETREIKNYELAIIVSDGIPADHAVDGDAIRLYLTPIEWSLCARAINPRLLLFIIDLSQSSGGSPLYPLIKSNKHHALPWLRLIPFDEITSCVANFIYFASGMKPSPENRWSPNELTTEVEEYFQLLPYQKSATCSIAEGRFELDEPAWSKLLEGIGYLTARMAVKKLRKLVDELTGPGHDGMFINEDLLWGESKQKLKLAGAYKNADILNTVQLGQWTERLALWSGNAKLLANQYSGNSDLPGELQKLESILSNYLGIVAGLEANKPYIEQDETVPDLVEKALAELLTVEKKTKNLIDLIRGLPVA